MLCVTYLLSTAVNTNSLTSCHLKTSLRKKVFSTCTTWVFFYETSFTLKSQEIRRSTTEIKMPPKFMSWIKSINRYFFKSFSGLFVFFYWTICLTNCIRKTYGYTLGENPEHSDTKASLTKPAFYVLLPYFLSRCLHTASNVRKENKFVERRLQTGGMHSLPIKLGTHETKSNTDELVTKTSSLIDQKEVGKHTRPHVSSV